MMMMVMMKIVVIMYCGGFNPFIPRTIVDFPKKTTKLKKKKIKIQARV